MGRGIDTSLFAWGDRFSHESYMKWLKSRQGSSADLAQSELADDHPPVGLLAPSPSYFLVCGSVSYQHDTLSQIYDSRKSLQHSVSHRLACHTTVYALLNMHACIPQDGPTSRDRPFWRSRIQHHTLRYPCAHTMHKGSRPERLSLGNIVFLRHNAQFSFMPYPPMPTLT